MKFLVRFSVLLLLIASLTFAGCILGGDDDDDPVVSTGEILLSADVDAPAGTTFAAALRGANAGDLRAARSSKFKAVIRIGGSKVADKELDLSDDGKKLTMAETSVTANTGKQQVTIEVATVTDEKPILKTIVTADVSATTPVDKKNTAVNTTTTAKAVAYEAWDGKSTKTIDDFAPASADLTTLETQIKTTLGSTIDGSKDLTDSAITTEAEKVADATPVPTTTTNRFSGNYRFFQLNASTQNRWVGMSEVTVSGNQFSAIVKLDPDPAEINTTYSATFTESNGTITFSGETTVRGAISPSGNIGLGHDWQASDPNIGLFIKKPTSASVATLDGTYRFYELQDSVNSSYGLTGTSRMTVSQITFNGAGNYSGFQVVYNDGSWSPTSTGEYSVSSCGQVTIGSEQPGSNEFMQVSADGNVVVFVQHNANDFCGFAVGIKQDSSLTTADMNGNWLYTCVSAGPGTPYSFTDGQLVTFNNGSSSWTNGVSDVSAEIPPDRTQTVAIGSNGTLSIDSDTYGALASNKELLATVSKTGTMRYISLAVKK